jgi:hypothetical protein
MPRRPTVLLPAPPGRVHALITVLRAAMLHGRTCHHISHHVRPSSDPCVSDSLAICSAATTRRPAARGGPITTRHDNTTALALARSSAVTGNAMAGSRYSVCRLSRRWRLHDSIRCSGPSLLRAAPAPVRSDLLLYDRRGREHQLVLCTRTALHHAADKKKNKTHRHSSRVLLCETDDLSTLRNTLPLNPVRTVHDHTRRRLLDRRSAASTGRGDP